ncbi:MAG: hypothetical protein JWQ89_1999 [Devosia sp.]|uniref:hypothetical protein n=1 Tax=Devosia sp. TaxID=1871048 RepID=UPI002630A856|nr:hypothetical protein [Devosia sp.]MDB5540272.1 hypothetical protein [Devosia sp.]
MTSQSHQEPHRPLLDPQQFEEAGRQFRLWLDRLLGHAPPEEDTEIAWEDGEPMDDRHNGQLPGH